MRCPFRFVRWLFVVLVLAPAAYAEPRFYLQAIEVRGTRHVSSGVVVAASLLETGQVYTESELRDAVRRVDRLPFVLAADLALERGRERGTYVLVLDVRTADARQVHPYEIPGARWMPLADVVQRASSLPRDTPIVTYCT